MATGTPHLCNACKSTGTSSCKQCKSVRYCSKKCQRVDWPTHKLLCQAFSTFDLASRPTAEHFLAISFPTDQNMPQLIWLPCDWHEDDDCDRYQSPNFGSLPGPDAFFRSMLIQRNTVLDRRLLDTIYICHRDAFLVDGSRTNQSVLGIISIGSGHGHDWRGPILAYSAHGLGMDPSRCRDLDMVDFRHIVDFFQSYPHLPGPAASHINNNTIKGVRINCIGDQKLLHKPQFEPVDVPLTDHIFDKHDISSIAARVGLPIYTRRYPPESSWANNPGNEIFERSWPFDNQEATFLHLSCSLDADNWGWAPMQWQNDVGSVLVVRQDRKPLNPFHIEALSMYCRYEILPLMAHSMGEYAPEKPLARDFVLQMICRATFVIYWYKFKEEKRAKGDYADAPFPFDV